MTNPKIKNTMADSTNGTATKGAEVLKYSAVVVCVDAAVRITVSEYMQI